MLVPDESWAGPSSTSSLSCWECWVSSGVTSDVASALRLSLAGSALWAQFQACQSCARMVRAFLKQQQEPLHQGSFDGCTLLEEGKDSLSSELELSGCHCSVTSHSSSQEDTSTGVNAACWREHTGMLCHPFPSAGGESLGCSSISGDLLARIQLDILVLQNCPSTNALFGGEQRWISSVSLSLNSQSLLWSCLLFTSV